MTLIKMVCSTGGDMIDIHLDNGSIIMLETKLLLADPRFASLREDDRILYPKTDGKSLYWRESVSLDLEDVIKILNKSEGKKE